MNMSIEKLIDRTKLPWPEVKIPQHSVRKFGEWEIIANEPPLLRGYFKGLQVMDRFNIVLLKNDSIWMSTTPMETESQQPALAHMHGTVVIIGGGLGMTVYNALQKVEVEKVILVEIDQTVIDIINSSNAFQAWPSWEKLEIIHTDALTMDWDQDIPVDFLWVDIWEMLGTDKALSDTAILYRKILPKIVGWWGMELDFVHFLAQGLNMPPIEENYNEWIIELGMPLLKAKEHWSWAMRVAENCTGY